MRSCNALKSMRYCRWFFSVRSMHNVRNSSDTLSTLSDNSTDLEYARTYNTISYNSFWLWKMKIYKVTQSNFKDIQINSNKENESYGKLSRYKIQ